MRQYGPLPESDEVRRAKGSWRLARDIKRRRLESVKTYGRRPVKHADEEHLNRITRLIPGYDPWATCEDCWFDYHEAAKRVAWFSTHLRHVRGPLTSRPFDLREHQQAEVANLFGWKRPDGTRRYREAYISEGRKNGKTTQAAGLALMMLCEGVEGGAEIYSAATTREQAGLVFGQAKRMAALSQPLANKVRPYQHAILYRDDILTSYKPISSESTSAHGLNPYFVVLDELHLQPNRDLYDALKTGLGARTQPLFISITTAGWDRNSICWEVYQYACGVRDGHIKDASFLPVIYELTPDDDWMNEENWVKANPNLGISIGWDYMRAEYRKALQNPAYENVFRQLHLNQWTQQANRFIPTIHWDRDCGGVLDVESLKGRQCFAGLDLATTRDLSALVLVFPDGRDFYRILSWFWLPDENIEEREAQDRVPYRTWAKKGFVELTPGRVTDYSYIRQRINEINKLYDVQELGYDPHNASHLASELVEQDGYPLERILQIPQTYTNLSEPTKLLLRLVLAGKIRHGDNPVLRWNADNLCVRMGPSGNVMPDKPKSTGRIDGMVALIMALGRAMIRKDGVSVYETQDPLIMTWS